MLLDFDAETKFPYVSKACLRQAAVGHNLIHRICEEVGKGRAFSGCIKTRQKVVFLRQSNT
jgi:hypothetical protein